MRPQRLFRLSVEPPPDFVARLDQLFPSHGRASWFVAAWVPGTPEDPVQRFVIYQAIPAVALSNEARQEIGWADAEVLPAGVRLTREQVALGTHVGLTFVAYRDLPSERLRVMRYWTEHRAVLQPVWVVQGGGGGHPYEYTQAEKRLLRQAGLAEKAPEMGSMPYAPLDQRVISRLVRIDTFRRGVSRAHLEDEQAREFRKQYVAQLTASTDDAFGEMAGVVQHMDLPTYDGPVSRDYEEAEARFVESGRLA